MNSAFIRRLVVGFEVIGDIDDPDTLFQEYSGKQVFYEGTHLAGTPWGTRKFALYDPDRNALTFYQDL